MLKELVIATGNHGKMRELSHLLGDVVSKMYSLADFPHLHPVVEDGHSFEENALRKAKATVSATGKPSLADDSGLVVPALEGKPGIYSARYAGLDADDSANNAKLLKDMDNLVGSAREAHFQCIIALCLPDGQCYTFSGKFAGIIIDSQRGDGGFGYDPLFLVPEYGKTLAELSLEVKNRISHRAQALKELIQWLDHK